jgi:hypothetical protein
MPLPELSKIRSGDSYYKAYYQVIFMSLKLSHPISTHVTFSLTSTLAHNEHNMFFTICWLGFLLLLLLLLAKHKNCQHGRITFLKSLFHHNYKHIFLNWWILLKKMWTRSSAWLTLYWGLIIHKQNFAFIYKNCFLIHRIKPKWHLNLLVNTAQHHFWGRSVSSRMTVYTVPPVTVVSSLTTVSSAKSRLNHVLR